MPALSPCARGLSLFLVVAHVVTPWSSLQHRRATQLERLGGTRTKVARVRRVRIGDRGRARLVEIDPLLSVGREVTESGPAPIGHSTCVHRRPRPTTLTDHGSSELTALPTHSQCPAQNACGKATITMCAVRHARRQRCDQGLASDPEQLGVADGVQPQRIARELHHLHLWAGFPDRVCHGHARQPHPRRDIAARPGQRCQSALHHHAECSASGGTASFLTAGCSAERLHGHDLACLDVRSPSPCLCLCTASAPIHSM
eukprot:COSAG01_NODE_446_length_16939_cov_19.753518_20_plen_258_part_00